MRAWGVGAVVWLTTSMVGPAQFALAASDGTEDELIRRGIDLRRHRNDEAAFPLFQKAYEQNKEHRYSG